MTGKTISTFEREMQNTAFKQEFDKGYKDFVLSEILIDLMHENHKTVRGLAEEVGLSPTIIQKVRSGTQKDLKISNFLHIAEACGYHLFLENDGKRIEL